MKGKEIPPPNQIIIFCNLERFPKGVGQVTKGAVLATTKI